MNPLQTIRIALGDDEAAAVPWTNLAQAITEIGAAPLSESAESALVEMLTPGKAIKLAGGHVPHSQSPEDMVRAAAIEVLWQRTGQKHAAVFQQLAQGPVSPIIKRLIASRLGPAGAAKPAADPA